MPCLHGVVDKVLIIKGFFEILINTDEVCIKDFGYVVQLPTDTTELLCPLCRVGFGGILHIGKGALE